MTIQALAQPQGLGELSEEAWSNLVASARQANLLGALAHRCEARGVTAPAPARRHLAGALAFARRQRESVIWEIHELQRALGRRDIPVVLLKGAAYVMAGHQVGAGRTFGDIDVLVRRVDLDAVESHLMRTNWVSVTRDAYDQQYYRQWMHELPPMMHAQRGTVIDVHHTILPLTARHSPDPAALIARSLPLEGLPDIRVPCPMDLLIHSLTHLMHEGELANGMRDLNDIDNMAREFGADAGFWRALTRTSSESDLAWPVLLGLRLAHAFYDTPVPAQVFAELEEVTRPTPRWLRRVYALAMQPQGGGDHPMFEGLARYAIYVRAHALRMPPAMLMRHLAIKAWREVRPTPTTSKSSDAP